MPKTITLLGSTGSIGTQSLDVARMHGYRIFGLAANSRVPNRVLNSSKIVVSD